MSKVAFLSLTAYGHLFPSLTLLENLTPIDQVYYFTTMPYAEKLKGTGVTYVPYSEAYSVPKPFTLLSHTEAIFQFYGRIETKILADLRSIQPDYIIYDSTLLFMPHLLKELDLPGIVFSAVLQQSLKLKDVISNSSRTEVIKALSRIFIKSVALGLNPFNLGKYPGQQHLIFTAPQIASRYMPRKSTYLGLAKRRESIEPDLEEFLSGNKRQLVYISFGTVYGNLGELIERSIKIALNLGAKVIASAPANSAVAGKFKDDENVYFAEMLPQQHILSYAQLFITHGGFNSINESLASGVPMVILPQMSEQHSNASLIEKLGAGVYIRGDKDLERAVARVYSGEEILLRSPLQEAIATINTSKNLRETLTHFKTTHNIR